MSIVALLRNPQQQQEWSIENEKNVQGRKNLGFELGWEIPNWFEKWQRKREDHMISCKKQKRRKKDPKLG
jgi:hypothetical protein